jgi:hypothetical protein
VAFTTDPFLLDSNTALQWSSDVFVLNTTIDPPPATGETVSVWTDAWKHNDGTITVEFDCSTGGDAVLCRAESIVVAQSESATQTITLVMKDEDFEFHPEGDGTYSDVMADGAEVTIRVTWGGHEKAYFGYFKDPGVSRDGETNIPTLTWVGTCVGDKLGRSKDTFETISPNASAIAPTNKVVLAQMTSAVGIAGDWSRILTTRIGTPFHRQQLLPGDILQKMLELTVDEWRTEYKTLTGYDPETGGRRWEYDVTSFTNSRRQIVFDHQITPQNNDPIDQVIVLRAVATGTLISTGTETVELRLSTFGDGNTVNFDPPLCHPSFKYKFRDHRAVVSYLLYYNGATLIAARNVLNPLDYPDNIKQAQIWNATSCSLTWGADNPTIDADLLEADGAIEFYGRPSPQATVGSGEDANDPLDTTTRIEEPEGEGYDNPIELPPNPLFYGEAEMRRFAQKYLRRVGRQQVEHSFKLPLNHLITLGDTIAIKRDGLLGGTGYMEVTVTGYSHSFSAFPEQRFTQVTGVKYV